jgi:hypothetical protein
MSDFNEDSWLEMAYEDRTYLPDDGDYWAEESFFLAAEEEEDDE